MRVPVALVVCVCLWAVQACAEGDNGVDAELWSVAETRFRAFGEDEKHNFADQKLTLTVVLRGPAVKTATHWGQVVLEEGVDSGRNELKLQAGYTNAGESWVQINREHMWFFNDNPPDDAIKIELETNPTARDADRIRSLQGVVKLKNSRVQDVFVDGLVGRDGTTVDDPALQAAGVRVKFVRVQPENTSESVKVQVTGTEDTVQDVTLVDPSGERVDNGKMWYRMGGNTTYSLGIQEGLRSDTRLKFTVETSRQVTDVPFSFKDIDLP